jgi:hypothetical protein
MWEGNIHVDTNLIRLVSLAGNMILLFLIHGKNDELFPVYRLHLQFAHSRISLIISEIVGLVTRSHSHVSTPTSRKSCC